jgi:hypothetical protein
MQNLLYVYNLQGIIIKAWQPIVASPISDSPQIDSFSNSPVIF